MIVIGGPFPLVPPMQPLLLLAWAIHRIEYFRPHAAPLSHSPSPTAIKYPVEGKEVLGHLLGVYGGW